MENLMKSFSPFLLSLFAVILFSPINALACACCADPGFYKISVQRPSVIQLRELKRLKFSAASLYSTAGFPDNVRGLREPVDGKYEASGTVDPGGWNFKFKDPNGKDGELNLRMPKNFVDYAVDLRRGERGGAGSVMLYKEWRFKFRVKNGSGIFADGIKGKTEYFLVLQGKGNACTSASDFTNWRLEVTGKKANYAFYGDLDNAESQDGSSMAKPGEKRVPPNRVNRSSIELSSLVGKDYVGCGCSGWNDSNGKSKKPIFWSEFKRDAAKETLILNLNGKDTELRLLSKGKRPEKEKIGDEFRDEYLADDGTKVVVDYTTTKLPCEGCEGTDYDVTLTVIGEFSGRVLSLTGSCGC